MSDKCLVDRGALKMALNVLRRNGRVEVAQALAGTIEDHPDDQEVKHFSKALKMSEDTGMPLGAVLEEME